MLVLLLALLATPCLSVIIGKPQDLPNITYDYVIVGAGTAGSVVASRLSENTSINVLLIEAGAQGIGHPQSDAIRIPGLVAQAAPNTVFDWNDTSTSQSGLDGRTVGVPRGHVLGGSSSINYLVYTRPSSDDYNKFATVTGDQGWSWDSMLPYMNKNERHVESADGHNTIGQFIPSVHGSHGPVLTSLPGYPTDIDDRVISTTFELSSEFPYNPDMNSGAPLGIGWMHSTIGLSVRSSAATAYLTPVLNRTNLHVLINTQVTRLYAINNNRSSRTDIRGVEFSENINSARFTVVAKKEVVSCAGAIGTPHLLLLSGIGDSGSLTQLNIDPLVHLPDVGKNLRDHPLVPFQWLVNSTLTSDTITESPELLAQSLDQYLANGTGLFVDALSNQLAYLRLASNSSLIARYGDSSNGQNSPHIEVAFCNGFVSTTQAAPRSGNYFTAAIIPVSPFSRGSVSLASSSAFDHPVIDLGLLSAESDAMTVVEGYRMIKKFLSASPWHGYIQSPHPDSANLTTDAAVIQYARKFASVMRHYQGTAAASGADDQWGVLNPDLTVKHVTGLRVVDASVFPMTFSAHTQAVVYAVAERAVELIKAASREE